VEIVFTNTLSGRKEPLVPREPRRVRLYWCGVTVYSRSHAGHARALVTADVLCRYLRARGLEVTFVRNFTDIDDKIIRRANEEGITAAALAEREIRAFQQDVAWLGCLPPTHEPRATEHIPAMLALIEHLVAAGFAYAVPDGSVYFRVRRFPAYGKLSHRRLDDMEAGEEIDPAKEDPHDFALWKGAKPGEPWWPSPWGRGRPGWHIECSAMATAYLGQPFEIHGGGSDLVFPHHENEIAQSEAAAGVPFADLWVHNGMITTGAEKMSKSLGNILSIAEVAEHAPAEVLRLLFLGTHYRTPLDFSSARLEESGRALGRLYEALARADEIAGGPPPAVPVDGALAGPPSPFLAEFSAAMDDDLNAARIGRRGPPSAASSPPSPPPQGSSPRRRPRSSRAHGAAARSAPGSAWRRSRRRSPHATTRACARTSARRMRFASSCASRASCSRTPRPARCGKRVSSPAPYR